MPLGVNAIGMVIVFFTLTKAWIVEDVELNRPYIFDIYT